MIFNRLISVLRFVRKYGLYRGATHLYGPFCTLLEATAQHSTSYGHRNTVLSPAWSPLPGCLGCKETQKTIKAAEQMKASM